MAKLPELSNHLAHAINEKHVRGKNLISQHHVPEAITLFNEAIHMDSGNLSLTAWIIFDKGKALTSVHRFEEAVDALKQSQLALPGSPWPHTELGEAYIGMKKLILAEEQFTLGIHKYAENSQALQGLQRIRQIREEAEALHVTGVHRLGQGDREGALQAYQQAVTLAGGENVPWSVFDLGKTLVSLGRYTDAISHFQRAKQLLPGVIWPDIEMGNALLALGQIGKAEHIFQLLITEQHSPDALAGLEKAKQLREAADVFHKEGVRLRSEGKYREALQQYEQVLNRISEVDSPWTVFDIGVILRTVGRVNEAIPLFERINNYLSSSWVHLQLGESYLEVGNLHAAQNSFEEVLRRDQRNTEAQIGLTKVKVLLREGYDNLGLMSIRERTLTTRMWNDGITTTDMMHTINWLADNPYLRDLVFSYSLIGSLFDNQRLLGIERIAVVTKHEEQIANSRYLRRRETVPRMKFTQWVAQENTDGMNTCYFASGVNALHSLGFSRETNERTLLSVLGDDFARKRPNQGATGDEAMASLRGINLPIDVKRSRSVNEILEAVEKGSAAIIPLHYNTVGTIAAYNRVYAKDDQLYIDVIKPSYGIISLPIRDLITSEITFAGVIRSDTVSPAIIITKK